MKIFKKLRSKFTSSSQNILLIYLIVVVLLTAGLYFYLYNKNTYYAITELESDYNLLKWSIVGPSKTPTPSPFLTPTPTPSFSAIWKQYAVVSNEQKVGTNDLVRRYWSPEGTYYLADIVPEGTTKPNYDYGGNFIQIHAKNGDYVFAFRLYPDRTNGSYPNVVKRFRNYWVNNHVVAFTFAIYGKDGDYPERQGALYYDVNKKTFAPVPEEYTAYDNNGGILIIEPKSPPHKVYYRKPDGTELYLGEGGGDLSPSGKYISWIYPMENKKEMRDEKGRFYYLFSVYVAPVQENGISQQVRVGEVKGFVGGIEGLVEPIYDEWSLDDKTFTVKGYFNESKTFNNPFIK